MNNRPLTNDIVKQHEYYVAKKNELIQRSRSIMPTQQYKLLLYLISKIKREDVEEKEVIHTISIREYCKVCNINYTSGNNYSDLKDAMINIDRQYAFMRLPEIKKDIRLRWFNRLHINYGSGTIEYSWHDDIKPYLFNLSSNYTQYQLMYALSLSKKYSIQLYELLKSYQHKNKLVQNVPLDELKMILNAQNYTVFKDFNRRVLEPAVEEINKYTDIYVKATPLADKGRAYTKICFVIRAIGDTLNADEEERRENLQEKLGYFNPISLCVKKE